MIVISLDCAFGNLGYGILDIVDDNIRIIDTGLIKSEDARPWTTPRVTTKTDKKTGEKVTSMSMRKRKGSISDGDTLRITEYSAALYKLCINYKVECVFAELPTGSQSSRSSHTLGFAKAVCITITTILELPSVWLNSHDVKVTANALRGITDKKAPDPTKAEIIDLVTSMYKGIYDDWPMNHYKNGRASEIKAESEHECDAIIVAHAAKGTREFLELQERQ